MRRVDGEVRDASGECRHSAHSGRLAGTIHPVPHRLKVVRQGDVEDYDLTSCLKDITNSILHRLKIVRQGDVEDYDLTSCLKEIVILYCNLI